MIGKLAIQQFSWQEIRDRIYSVNPGFAQTVDTVDPNNSLTVYSARYRYGQNILKDGHLYFPGADGELIPFDSRDVPERIRDELGYYKGTNPITMVLHNGCELFIPLDDRVIPYAVVAEGQMIGLWPVLDFFTQEQNILTPVPIWDFTAGARSTFLLPNIKNKDGIQRLSHHIGKKITAPKQLIDHFHIFSAISAETITLNEWHVELLFFPKEWLSFIKDTSSQLLQNFIVKQAWSGSSYWRNQFCWDLTLSWIDNKYGVAPPAYVADITTHLLAMYLGAVPGLRLAFNQNLLPLTQIQTVFQSVYRSTFAPLVMVPGYIPNDSSASNIYYSFNYHTAIKLSPKTNNRDSTLLDMYHIRKLLQKYLSALNKSDVKLSGPHYDLLAKARFSFCHKQQEAEYDMLDIKKEITKDPLLEKALSDCSIKSLPKNAPALTNCIIVSKKPS